MNNINNKIEVKKEQFLKELKNCKLILDYPYYFSTKLFYFVYKLFIISKNLSARK